MQLSGRSKRREKKSDSAADGEQRKDKEQWEETEIKRDGERESGDKEWLQQQQQQWRDEVCPGGGRKRGRNNVQEQESHTLGLYRSEKHEKQKNTTEMNRHY